MLLDDLNTGQSAEITMIDWTMLPELEGKRLRALGLDEGAHLTMAERGILFGRDPLAINIGRMKIAIRRLHARAISIDHIDMPFAETDDDPAGETKA